MASLLIDHFEKTAREHPDRPAIHCLGVAPENDVMLSYGKVDGRASGYARLLRDTGVKRGDIVSLIGANSPNWMTAYLACQKIGAVVNPINPDLTAMELPQFLAHTEPSAVITVGHEFDGGGRPLIKADPFGEAVTVAGVAKNLDETPLARDPAIEPQDPMSVLFTSGTTGKLPKAVVTPNDTLLHGIDGYRDMMDLNGRDRVMIVTPLFHSSALHWAVTMTLQSGATLLMTERFSASRFWEQAARGGVTIFWTLAAIPFILLQSPPSEAEAKALQTLRFMFAAGSGTREAECRARWGKCFQDGWGMTETAGTFTDESCFGLKEKFPCVGRPVPGIDIAIADPETGEKLPDHAHGEIVTRFGQGFSTYLKNPEAMAESVRNGWFHTGDIGYRDTQGRFYFVDRLKDIIRRGGENIASRDVEKAMAGLPGVAEAHAVAKPDAVLGERVCLYIVPDGQSPVPTLMDVRKHCAVSLPELHLPEDLRIVDADDLPRTPSGRVKKAALKEALRRESHAKETGT